MAPLSLVQWHFDNMHYQCDVPVFVLFLNWCSACSRSCCGLNLGICLVLERENKPDAHCKGRGDSCPHRSPLLWGQYSLVCSHLGLHNDHTADGDPYCCGHMTEMRSRKWCHWCQLFLAVRRLLRNALEYLCKYTGNCSLEYLLKLVWERTRAYFGLQIINDISIEICISLLHEI